MRSAAYAVATCLSLYVGHIREFFVYCIKTAKVAIAAPQRQHWFRQTNEEIFNLGTNTYG